MIRFGLIGCGRIADQHLASLAACEDAELVALCDIRPERMESAESKYRSLSKNPAKSLAQDPSPDDEGIRHYGDVGRLLSDARVDAVVISTHSALHADLALRALRAGKHVVLEKPMTLGTHDAEEIIKAAKLQDRVVQVCHQLRYRPLMRRVKQLVDQGALGRLHLGTVKIRLSRSPQYYAEASWRGTWEQDGGMLLNQGIHLIDLLQWFLGEATHVYGRMARTNMPKQTEDVAAGIIRFKNGAIGVVEANTIAQPGNFDNEIALFGDKGTICIGGIQMRDIRRWHVDGRAGSPGAGDDSPHSADGAAHRSARDMASAADDGKQSEPVAPQTADEAERDEHLLMYEAFVSAVKGNRGGLLVDALEGSKALGIIFGMYESVRREREVTLPIADFSTKTMAEVGGWS